MRENYACSDGQHSPPLLFKEKSVKNDDKEKRQTYSRRLFCCRSFSLVDGNNVLTTSRTHSSYSRRRHFCRRKFTIIRELSEIRNRAKRLCKKIIFFVCFVYLCLQRMRKIKPFKLFDVTRILNPAERQRMMTCAVNRILAAESELAISKQITQACSSFAHLLFRS